MNNKMKAREFLSLALCLLLAGGTTQAQEAAPPGTMTIEDLRMTVSRSLVIDYPADISRISTSNPEVVDAVPATTREFLLHGKGIGAATVVVWAKNGQRTMYNITVDHNLEPLRRLLKETFPNENIQVQAGRDSVSMSGIVSSKEVGERAQAMLAPLAKNVVNTTMIASGPVSKQIMLKVRFAQLDRQVASQFGVNLASTGFLNTPFLTGTQQYGSARIERVSGAIPGGVGGTESTFQITDALNIFAFRPDLNLTAFVKNLQNQGLLQILAEPTLTTTNGKEASFLVGGEFPIPILQGGSNAGAVTVQFREFGIRLNFNPVITENNTIKLYVKPEVSTIDLANSVTLSGFTIPALATKRMETNIELGEGQSFVIAGLIDDRVQDSFNKMPGLASIPVLGALFKSKSDKRSKSELIVMVTPEIATPLNPGDTKPSPVWVKPFLPSLKTGEDAGMGIIKPTIVPTVPQAENREPMPNQKPRAAAGQEEDGGPLGRLKFWGKDKDKKDQGKTAQTAAGAQPAKVAGAQTTLTTTAPTAPSTTPATATVIAADPVSSTPAGQITATPAPATPAPAVDPGGAPATTPATATPAAAPATPAPTPDPGGAASTATPSTIPAAAAPDSGKRLAAPPKADTRAEARSRRPAAVEITSLPDIAGRLDDKKPGADN